MADAEIAGGPNGSGAAAVLSAAIGWFTLGVLALAGDAVPRVKLMLILWKPTGALSGVTSLAILVWLVVWMVLGRRWRDRDRWRRDRRHLRRGRLDRRGRWCGR